MAKQISWSPDAKHDYLLILDYLNAHWSQREVLNFIDRTEEVLHLIADNPLLFVSSEKRPGVHRCVIVNQVSLFYRIQHKTIELLRFWDNRMDPTKLEY